MPPIVLPAIAAIGAPTSAALTGLGLAPQITASVQTLDGLLDAVAGYLRVSPSPVTQQDKSPMHAPPQPPQK